MINDKEVAHALGYHAKAHCRAKCVQDFAPYEYRNNIDLQLAFVAGWKEAVADDEVNRLSQSSDAKYDSLVSAIGMLSRAMEELRRVVERQNNPSYSLGGAGVGAAGNVSGNCGGGGGRGASGVRVTGYDPSIGGFAGGGGGGDASRSRGTSYGCNPDKIAADFGMKPPKTVVVTLDTDSMNWKIPEDMHDVVVDAVRDMGAVNKDALDMWRENQKEIHPGLTEYVRQKAVQKAIDDDKTIMDYFKRAEANRNVDPMPDRLKGWKGGPAFNYKDED